MTFAGVVVLGAFVVSSIVVGLRLLLLASKTRGLPELAIGMAFMVGGIGYALVILPDAVAMPSVTAALAVRIFGAAFSAASACLVTWFTRRLFRPEDLWSALLLGAVVAGHLVSLVARILQPETTTPIAYLGFSLANVLGYGWAGLEAGVRHGMLKKRARLGLADAELTNRMLLWCVSWISCMSIALTHLISRLQGYDHLPPFLLAPAAVLMIVAAGAAWLAFLPPAAYRRYLHRPIAS